MNKARNKARLEELYTTTIRPALQKQLALNNIMEVPKLSKIVLNIGVKDAVSDSKALQPVIDMLSQIAGQKAVRTVARKSIATFKLREGMFIGAKVTLRGKSMYEFLDRLINLSLPKVRDFQGVRSKAFDGRGNYNLGIKENNIFPELENEIGQKSRGLNITIATTAREDKHGLELLKSFNMPFEK